MMSPLLVQGSAPAMLPRQKEREIIMQTIYSKRFADLDPEQNIPFLMEHFKITRKNAFKLLDEVALISEKQEVMNEMIEGTLKDYRLERVGSVELAALHVLLFELLLKKTIDEAVAVAEAQRLIAKFSHEAAGQFVVAVIKEVAKQCSKEDES
jgi:transcription termination factor NusB